MQRDVPPKPSAATLGESLDVYFSVNAAEMSLVWLFGQWFSYLVQVFSP